MINIQKYELGRWKDQDGDWFSLPMIPSDDGRWIKYSTFSKFDAYLNEVMGEDVYNKLIKAYSEYEKD